MSGQEQMEKLFEVANQFIFAPDICIERCGTWLYATGKTYQYKDRLKALGFRWDKDRRAWVYHVSPYQKSYPFNTLSLPRIRQVYGCETLA